MVYAGGDFVLAGVLERHGLAEYFGLVSNQALSATLDGKLQPQTARYKVWGEKLAAVVSCVLSILYLLSHLLRFHSLCAD